MTERFSRVAPSSREIELKTKDGDSIKIRITDEHPVHLEGWDGKPRGDLLSELNALDGDEASSSSTASLFPSNEKTPFGDWVKAGALKAGDTVSTLSSIASNGPTLQRAVQLSAANNNAVGGKPDLKDQLTVEDLKRLGVKIPANDNGYLGNASTQELIVASTRNLQRAIRVYNLEIESRPGEITHNYLVGDELIWVHNARKPKLTNIGPDSKAGGYPHTTLGCGLNSPNI